MLPYATASPNSGPVRIHKVTGYLFTLGSGHLLYWVCCHRDSLPEPNEIGCRLKWTQPKLSCSFTIPRLETQPAPPTVNNMVTGGGLEPPRPCDLRILSAILAYLQRVARRRMLAHKSFICSV
jgi:hypothetical protein